MRVSFDGEFEMVGVFGVDSVGDFLVGGSFEFEDVCFSAHAPRPKTVAVTVRNQRKPVKFTQTPVHRRVTTKPSFQSVNMFGRVLVAVLDIVKAAERAKHAEPWRPCVSGENHVLYLKSASPPQPMRSAVMFKWVCRLRSRLPYCLAFIYLN